MYFTHNAAQIETHLDAQNLENGNLTSVSMLQLYRGQSFGLPFASHGNDSPIVPILVGFLLHLRRE